MLDSELPSIMKTFLQGKSWELGEYLWFQKEQKISIQTSFWIWVLLSEVWPSKLTNHSAHTNLVISIF